MSQPGEQWRYNTGAQVLGAVLERTTGKSLEAVLHERILGPLGMSDTAFTVSPAMNGRLTTAYETDWQTGELAVVDGVDGGYWSQPLAFPSASAWLVSTIDNFWTFVQMLLSGGTHEGTRILSEGAVERMTTDHLEPGQRELASPFLSDTQGWGYCMAAPPSGASPDRPRRPSCTTTSGRPPTPRSTADCREAARQPTFGSPAALSTPSIAGLATRRYAAVGCECDAPARLLAAPMATDSAARR
jgi:CubicO group peptidase (beta-lactamase class C family)